MRTKRRALGILLAVCICLSVCAAALALYTPEAAGGTADDVVYTIHDIPVGQIEAIAITNGKATFGLMQRGGEITMVSAVEGNYSLSELRTLVYAAGHITGTKEMTDLSVAADYGIDNPLARVTVIKQDGSESNFSILMQNPIDGSYYLFSEDKQAIYLVPAAQAELFMRREEDFISHTVFPPITSANYRELEWVTLDFNGNGRDYMVMLREDQFYISQPICQRVALPVVMEELLRYISSLYAEEIVAQGVDLQEYGFAGYDLMIAMRYGGSEYAAFLVRTADGTVLVGSPADGTVYRMEESDLAVLQRDYLVLTKGYAYNYAAGDLRSVAVSDGQREVLFDVAGEGEGISAMVQGRMVERDEFLQLVAALNGAGIEREWPGEPQGELLLRIVYTMQTGSMETVEFFSDDGSVPVAVNGVVNFTTTPASLQAIRDAAFAYLPE